VCGYEHHGPKGNLGFAPRLSPENFRCAFTTAEGWGTFSQKSKGPRQNVEIRLKRGQLHLKTLTLQVPQDRDTAQVRVTVAGNDVPATLAMNGRQVNIHLKREIRLETGQTLDVAIT